jgi:hypothetical protein
MMLKAVRTACRIVGVTCNALVSGIGVRFSVHAAPTG